MKHTRSASETLRVAANGTFSRPIAVGVIHNHAKYNIAGVETVWRIIGQHSHILTHTVSVVFTMKRAFALIVVAVICLLGGAPTAAAPKLQPKGPTVEEVRRTLFATSWFETGKVVAGKNDPDGPLGWKFGAEEVENWQITGELVTDRMFGGAKIDVAGDLWRLDIYSKNDKGRVSVLPTIFKFEGKTLVWVTEFPGEGWYSEIARNGEYNGRPTSFESTAKNRYAVRRFKPCDYLQTTEPE